MPKIRDITLIKQERSVMPEIRDITTIVHADVLFEVDDTAISVGRDFVTVANAKGVIKLIFEHPQLLHDFIGTLERLETAMRKEKP